MKPTDGLEVKSAPDADGKKKKRAKKKRTSRAGEADNQQSGVKSESSPFGALIHSSSVAETSMLKKKHKKAKKTKKTKKSRPGTPDLNSPKPFNFS